MSARCSSGWRPWRTYGSVRLFIERAAEAGGSVVDAELPVVAEICRRLEGLPLAIELAASRARHLSIQALLGRLGEPLPLLSGGPVDVPVRHRALRHTISWSYDLLDPELAAFFGDLGVFDGAFGLEAAHAVAGARVGSSDAETLEALTALVDQSLIRSAPTTPGEPRFVMHETIGRFAVDVIDDEAAARDRHLAYFVDLAERIEPELERADQARWTNVLVGELENLRGALRWAARSASTVATPETRRGARQLLALARRPARRPGLALAGGARGATGPRGPGRQDTAASGSDLQQPRTARPGAAAVRVRPPERRGRRRRGRRRRSDDLDRWGPHR